VGTGREAQLQLIRDIAAAMSTDQVPWWLFGGWGLDARIGRITRDHGDIEFWVDRSDGERTRIALEAAGFVALDTQPVQESREFVKDGVVCSSAFFDRATDGTYRTQGRWSDWVFPPDAFPRSSKAAGRLGNATVPAMSVSGMLAMKTQFAGLRNGRPLREKDARDIRILRDLAKRSPSLVPLAAGRAAFGVVAVVAAGPLCRHAEITSSSAQARRIAFAVGVLDAVSVVAALGASTTAMRHRVAVSNAATDLCLALGLTGYAVKRGGTARILNAAAAVSVLGGGLAWGSAAKRIAG
jgi:lincosamide nucleotidyltransferase A/C/D/E